MRYKCVMFDFGHTLILPPKRMVHRRFLRSQLAKLGRKFSIKQIGEAWIKTLGYKGSREFHSNLLRELGVSVNHKRLNSWWHAYIKFHVHRSQPMPNALKILRMLKSNNVRIVLVTNGGLKLVRSTLVAKDMLRYFDVIVSAGKLNFKKSSLRPFKFVLSKLRLKPSECLMVGDNLDEDAYAKKLGIDVAWIVSRPNAKYRKPVEKFDFKIKNLSELKRIVK